MVENSDIIRMFRNFNRSSKQGKYVLSKDEKYILMASTGSPVCTVEEFAAFQRRKQHCDFVVLAHDETTQVLRCKECGTIIFNNGDRKMKCPVCADYHTTCVVWRKQDMDRKRKKYIKALTTGHAKMEEYHGK